MTSPHLLRVALALVAIAAPAAAQQLEVPALSPAARVEQRVGLTDFSVDYSSPAVRKRTIFGGLLPWDKPWRTGANAATTLKASRDFKFGGKTVKAGAYTLYTIPSRGQWTVALNTGDHPQSPKFDPKKDVARIRVKPQAIPARERLTFIFSDTTEEGTRLDLEWEKVRISIPLQVDTADHVKESMAQALEGAWRPHFTAARYLLDNGGDLKKALSYADTSISIQPTWWNNWIRAQILARQGKEKDAVSAARKAQQLGKGDRVYENFFKAEVEKTVAAWKK